MIHKLSALGFSVPPKFDIKDESSRRRLVSWLEDQIIRHLPITDRCGLRQVDSNDFIPCINDYLVSIECPWKWSDNVICIDWLINFALRLHYEDSVKEEEEKDKLNQQEVASMGGNDESQSTFSSLDWRTDDVTRAVDKLAESLNIACHPDRQVTLEALSRLLEKKREKKLSEENQRTGSNQQSSTASKQSRGSRYTLDTAELITTAKQGEAKNQDEKVIIAEKVLRLIHLNQLRSLQNVVNDITVTAQAITAQPATNAALASKSDGKKIK